VLCVTIVPCNLTGDDDGERQQIPSCKHQNGSSSVCKMVCRHHLPNTSPQCRNEFSNPQTFLNLNFQCKPDISEVKQTSWDGKELANTREEEQTSFTLATAGGRAAITHLGDSRRQNKGLIPLEDLRWQLHSLCGLGCTLAAPTPLASHLLTKARLGQGCGQGWGQHRLTARHGLTCCTCIAADVGL